MTGVPTAIASQNLLALDRRWFGEIGGAAMRATSAPPSRREARPAGGAAA